MKTNNTKKLALGLIATTTILGLGLTSVSAMWNGQGGWNGLGKVITAEEKAKLQSMDENERQEYMNELKSKYNVTSWKGQGKWESKGQWNKGNKEAKEWHNPAEMLEWVEKQDLSDIEIDLLQKQYEEEMMSNELYTSFYEMYGIETFKKIAASEAKHMEAVKALFDRYELELPTNYDHIKDLYEELKEKGSKSAFDALEVWIKIEFVDIDDIVKAIKSTDNDDMKIVLTNIGWASYNHLRGFLKAIDSNGYETDLDYSPYLNESDLSVKWPIKYKLAEKLEADGVELPEQVSSENMKKKCAEKKAKHDNDEKEGKHDKNEEHKNMSDNKMTENKSKVNTYKNAINAKYGALIAKLDETKLQTISDKIDDLLVKTTSEKTKLVLIALKEIVEENLGNTDLDIDGLLK